MNSKTYCPMSSTACFVTLALGGTAFCMIFCTEVLSFIFQGNGKGRGILTISTRDAEIR